VAVGAVQAIDSGAEAEADDLIAEDEEEGENTSEKEDRCEESIVKGQERGKGGGSPAKSVPDMYKAFDGSALMAIGPSPLLKILHTKLIEVTQVCCSKSIYRCF